MVKFRNFDENFVLEENISSGSLKSLSLLEDYIDFGIHTTIRKQMPTITEEKENYYAKVLLTKYLNKEISSFTSDFGIRNNLYFCDEQKIFQVLIKQAIEEVAFKQGILHELNTNDTKEFICDLIAKKMYNEDYEDALTLVSTNKEFQKALISNYIDLKYGSSVKNQIEENALNGRVPISKTALNNLKKTIEKDSKKKGVTR